MAPEVRQLEAFAATARTGSFTRAAQTLGIGQPAVSQAVRRLEADLGVVLFERTSRSVTPTAAGAALLPSADAMLDALRATQRVAAGLAEGRVGTLRLVSTPGSLELLRRLLDAFASACPDARVDLVPRPAAGKREGLRRGEVDVALVRTAKPAPGIAYTPARREPWGVVLAAAHAAADISLAALAERPFATLGEGSPALDAYLDAAEVAGLTPQLGPAAGAIDDLFALVAGGDAWTLLTASNAGSVPNGLVVVPAPPELRPAELWLAHRSSPTALERALLALAAHLDRQG